MMPFGGSNAHLILISLGICLLGAAAEAKYGGGSGTADDPYLIYTPEQMNAIGGDPNDWDKHFRLMADISLIGFTGTSFNIIGRDEDNPFTGGFDGNGKRISNFNYTSADADYVGLFGCVRSEYAPIKDLGLIEPNIEAGTGECVGSLVGYHYYGTIRNCYAVGGSVSGSSKVGGLVGYNNARIFTSYASSSAAGSGDYVGGLAGYNSGEIFSCTSSGSVSGYDNVGGLTGYNEWMISESCATGSASGRDVVGGLVGWNRRAIWSTPSGQVAHCYAAGSVSGANDVGGLIGKNNGGAAFTSFWDVEATGQATSDAGTGKTTAEMQDVNTFLAAEWDFVGEYENGPNDDWAEPMGGRYPVLSWQLTELPELPSFSGGSGTIDDPYLISTVSDLSSVGHNPRLMGGHFKLTSDIDLAGARHFIIGNRWFPFAGTFDGDGHEISNFKRYRYTGEFCIGLFGIVDGVEACIRDLGVRGSELSGGGYVTVGSLVGRLKDGTVSGCYAQNGEITVFEAGGGGLVGANNGMIRDCYANVSVSGWFAVGGLVEYNYGTIWNSYSVGKVDSTFGFGGLVITNFGTVTNSFWDIQASGETGSEGGIGLTTAEMQRASTFVDAGWDFDEVWDICEGTNYPRLRWQIPKADLLCPDGVTMIDYSLLTSHWLQESCGDSNDCSAGADLDQSSSVGFDDLAIFADDWLAGIR